MMWIAAYATFLAIGLALWIRTVSLKRTVDEKRIANLEGDVADIRGDVTKLRTELGA